TCGGTGGGDTGVAATGVAATGMAVIRAAATGVAAIRAAATGVAATRAAATGVAATRAAATGVAAKPVIARRQRRRGHFPVRGTLAGDRHVASLLAMTVGACRAPAPLGAGRSRWAQFARARFVRAAFMLTSVRNRDPSHAHEPDLRRHRSRHGQAGPEHL